MNDLKRTTLKTNQTAVNQIKVDQTEIDQIQASLNEFSVVARIVEKKPIRYTPAGFPVLECQLFYKGNCVEAGMTRQIEMTLSAIAIGSSCNVVNDCSFSKMYWFSGFLAHRRRNARSILFHIQKTQLILEIDHESF